uniref:Uncharacterized protein n=1 Tax=Aegilops tauschii subsp. strangulata TaxID=200361 RepID=A0A453GEG3_AEGTS
NLSYNPLSLQIRNFMDLSMKVFVVVLLLLVATGGPGTSASSFGEGLQVTELQVQGDVRAR